MLAAKQNKKDHCQLSVKFRLTSRPVFSLSVPTFRQMSRFFNHFVRLSRGLVKIALI